MATTRKKQTSSSEIVLAVEQTSAALELLDQTTRCKVGSEDEAGRAADLLARIRKVMREMDESRKVAVEPLQKRVKQINATFKRATDPLDAAVSEIRAKISAYMEERTRQANALRALNEAKGSNEPKVTMTVTPAPVRGKSDGALIVERRVIDWEVTDWRQIPVQGLDLNNVWVRAKVVEAAALAKAYFGNGPAPTAEELEAYQLQLLTQVGGLRFFVKTDVSVRSG